MTRASKCIGFLPTRRSAETEPGTTGAPMSFAYPKRTEANTHTLCQSQAFASANGFMSTLAQMKAIQPDKQMTVRTQE